MKKISILIVVLLMASIKSVNAASFYNYLPGGKNYLDESNFSVSTNSISSIKSFLVKDNTDYTLSFPGTGMIGSDISIKILGNDQYFMGNVSYYSNCMISEQESYCTFKTIPGEDYLSLSIEAPGIINYINYYGFQGFQLEEGTNATKYEEYISPYVDTENPEFSGTGAYIKSYSTSESIDYIINQHISVIDDIDGDITDSINIISDEYTGFENTVGEYLVQLRASDEAGNTAYFNLNIIVKDEIPPTISGQSSVEYNISENPSLMTIINDSFVIEDGYSSTSITIVNDDYTLNKDTIGTYMVTFEVLDENLNKSSKIFHITLLDRIKPKLESSLVIDSYLSNPFDTDEILNTLDFSDNYSDMTSVTIDVLSNELIGNENTVGTYTINFEVADESGNKLNENLTVYVIDDVLPQIGGPLSYQGSYTENLSLNDFINMLNVSDNTGSVSIDDVYVIADSYSNRTSETGSFLITFGIKDENLNESIHTMNITVFDDVAPIIYVDNYIVTVDASSTFTTDDALNLLINSEELIEGSYSVNVLFDEYTGNENTEGSYLYLLEFTNKDGESYEKEFLVQVLAESESKINRGLLTRNIIVYSISITFFGFVVYKNRK